MGLHRQSFRFEGGGRQMIGLNRTGKSCRLRWVNYLHPGLKRGKMTPQEERLVLELHAKWGNRWSRIARRLPGRTDNEIKNYWRTHMRKKAQEKKRATNNNNNNNPPPSSPSSSTNSKSSSSSSSNITTVESLPFPDSTTGVESFYDTGGRAVTAPVSAPAPAPAPAFKTDKKPAENDKAPGGSCYSLDDIWKEISLPEVNIMEPLYGAEAILEGNNVVDIICDDVVDLSCPPVTATWDQLYCSDSLWKMDDEASKPLFVNNFPTAAIFSAGFEYLAGETALTSG